MLSPSDTVYPQLARSPSGEELDRGFTPNVFELKFAEDRTREPLTRVGLLVLLKTFQRLGYFVRLADVPDSIVRHIAIAAGLEQAPLSIDDLDSSTVRFRHMNLVRAWLGVTAFDRDAHRAMAASCVEAARIREDLADIINIAIEELIRQRFELPGFTTLFRAARTARVTVNTGLYQKIGESLDAATQARLLGLLTKDPKERKSGWEVLKAEPGQPTVKRIRGFISHLDWVRGQAGEGNPLAALPAAKLQRFAAEAQSLNIARMNELTPPKRLALTAALAFRQLARAYDDGSDMLIRQVQKIHYRAEELLRIQQAEHLERSADLVATLRDIAVAYRQEGSAEDRLNKIGTLLGFDIEGTIQRCEEHSAIANGNSLRFHPRLFRHPRTALLMLLKHLPLRATSQDVAMETAIAFVVSNADNKSEWLPVTKDGMTLLNLAFVPDLWWPLVTGTRGRGKEPDKVHHRYLELCILAQVSNELKSGDLCIPQGERFRDYRQQLVSWEVYNREARKYGEQAGFPTDGKLFVADLRKKLNDVALATDRAFPANQHVRIENNQPVLTPVRSKDRPADVARAEQLLKEGLASAAVDILDALSDTEHWLNWTRFFGPLSGHDTKLERPRERYLLTVFCYGCNLGPVQTARSVRGIDRFSLAFVNQRHITEANLNEAITAVINAYAQLPLQRLWGPGRSASADGMKWDLYPQNLVSEYHVRYGGYGGIGYYLVADCYIALFSRFTTCGSWEGHYILDFLKENQSAVEPDTIHADTQGQSTAIFGLAYLLGIQLMPRIRNWKDQHLFRPSAECRYEHIDALFTAKIDGELIETMLPDMLRLALSVKFGTVLPSDILRRLGSFSRKNKLYFALRELGRAVRTMFLLRYLSDAELRYTITAATNKSERFNQFVQWLSFGGDHVIAENVRDEQRKFIKYNHLVANLLIFHNLVSMSRVLRAVEEEGCSISEQALAMLTPYQTEHINRFGNYVLDFDRAPEPIQDTRKPPTPEKPAPPQPAVSHG